MREPGMDEGTLLAATTAALAAGDALLARMRQSLRDRLGPDSGGRIPDSAQHAAHVLAWFATTLAGLRQTQGWLRARQAEGTLDEPLRDLALVAFGEYLAQATGGIPMSQVEMARPDALGLGEAAAGMAAGPEVRALVAAAESGAPQARLAECMAAGGLDALLDRDGLGADAAAIRDQFRRFAAERVTPQAQAWHLADRLIPAGLLAEMAELGVFGVTVPEAHGGAGLGKLEMCVISEELSRAWIGVGSLATRSEIAAELILGGGTPEQRQAWLPGIASGAVVPTAVFTEPDTGSDLGALATRAERCPGGWRITGAKNWITHAARANLMTLLARTDPSSPDHRGLSMFLAPKTPGGVDDPFPDPGLDGSEIGVLGYRGMKEYALAFDGFEIGGDSLLGGREGEGFRQLMRTFESARIQTAARAVGVARSAVGLGLDYALERRQFGRRILDFPRVHRKLAMMAAETLVSAQLAYGAARAKDAGRRCDLEAGMAKLLAARVAWAAADNAVQIHGGNGFALEFPVSRVLCDARILNIFEGAAEIQATIIARRLLATGEEAAPPAHRAA